MTTHTAAYERFIASMKIGYMEHHDGVPYDLEALAAISPEELQEVEALLIRRSNEDWRDVEALAKINSPAAIEAVKASTRGPNREVRIRAAELLAESGRFNNFDELIVEGLQFGKLGSGLAESERLAAAHPSEAVKSALMQGALCSTDGRAVRFVGILFFLHGKADEPFDWSQRPFFLRFNTNDPKERRLVFGEMCQLLGVDGSNVSCGSNNPERAAKDRPWWQFWK